MKNKIKNRQGFTLIEMTVVLFIISLLIFIIIPNISSARNHAQDVHNDAMVSVVQSQIDAYLEDDPHPSKDIQLQTLSDAHYLTPKQVDRAQDDHIVINNNKASLDNSK